MRGDDLAVHPLVDGGRFLGKTAVSRVYRRSPGGPRRLQTRDMWLGLARATTTLTMSPQPPPSSAAGTTRYPRSVRLSAKAHSVRQPGRPPRRNAENSARSDRLLHRAN